MGAFECVSASKILPSESTEVFAISMSSNTTLNEPRRDAESQSTKAICGRRHSLRWLIGIRVDRHLPLFAIFLAALGLFELGVIPQHMGAFKCNDPLLSHPNVGDTVSTAFIMSGTLLMPFAIFFPTEYIFTSADFLGRSKLRRSIVKSLLLYRTYMYGLMFNFGAVELMKGFMGSPRPDFFAVCEPDAAKTCVGSEYVYEYKCTPNSFSTWYQMDSYRSFPSGHASLSVHTGLFLAWYLQRRAFDWRHRTIFVVPFLQLLCFTYTIVCSLTRITDHRHHWWDVLFGVILGLATFFYTVLLTNYWNNEEDSRSPNDINSERSQHTVKTLLYEARANDVRRDTVP